MLGEDLAVRLRDHPEVKVICRDRSSGYSGGARLGAPQAEQVADRYHLWANLGQAVEKTVNAHRSNLAGPSPGDTGTLAGPEAEPEIVQPSRELKIVIRLREQHAAAHDLWAQGMSKAAIGRKLGLHRATVRKLVDARSADDVVAKSLQRAHIVDPYVGYLHQRWNEGVRNAAQLHREIRHSHPAQAAPPAARRASRGDTSASWSQREAGAATAAASARPIPSRTPGGR